MKKFFVPCEGSDYHEELLEAFERSTEVKLKGRPSDITSDFIEKNRIDVVICNELSKDQYLLLKGLEVPVITIGDTKKYFELSDIVIDFKAEDDKRYFAGTAGKIKGNIDLRIDKILNLVEKLEWDSGFFGFNVAYISCMHLTENIMKRVKTFAEREEVRLIEYLCNCHNAESVRLAEQYGFNFVDVRLVFRQQLNLNSKVEIYNPNNYEVRRATQDDLRQLIPIARESYVDSRYYFDNHFSEERCQQFYEDWLKKSVVGQFDDLVFTICDQGKPIAFITAKKQSEDMGKIGLVGVHKDYQGKGIGKTLMTKFFDWAHENSLSTVDVVTQGRNYSAQKLYQSMGFRTKLVQLWYHKWVY